jgi:hypothetical protein
MEGSGGRDEGPCLVSAILEKNVPYIFWIPSSFSRCIRFLSIIISLPVVADQRSGVYSIAYTKPFSDVKASLNVPPILGRGLCCINDRANLVFLWIYSPYFVYRMSCTSDRRPQGIEWMNPCWYWALSLTYSKRRNCRVWTTRSRTALGVFLGWNGEPLGISSRC